MAKRVAQIPRGHTIALGYLRVSTDEQADSGASLPAQRAQLQSYADSRGWYVVWVVDAGISGKSLDRAGMTYALPQLTAGHADVLLATALDRMSRDVGDVAHLMRASVTERWALVSVRESIDTSTAMGRAFVQIAAVFAELERGLIAERVRDGMAQKRADGWHMGRRTALAPETIQRIFRDRQAGIPWQHIADALTADGIPTPTGRAVWSVSSVQSAFSVNPAPRYAAAQGAGPA